MSGLAALFHRDGRPVGEASVWAMLDAIPYRGPDGQTVHCSESVGLGSARMVITQEDQRESQPIVSPRTGCILVADVRLDNRDELLSRLGHESDATSGDGELLLQAYEAWDLASFELLLGDFACVIWDPRTRRMIAARDTSGQRSLYYRVDSRTFVAASEIHQLFQDPSIPIEPNDDRIHSHFAPLNMSRNIVDQNETFYRNIFAVPSVGSE